MTVKRQILIVLTLIAIVFVIINTLVLSTLTDRYFKDYIKDRYDEHFNQIVEYLSDTLSNDKYTLNQISIDLETHLIDPITRIKVYDTEGNLLSDVSTDARSYVGDSPMRGMMKHMMERSMKSRFEEVDNAQIINNEKVIGQVNIISYSSAENSTAIWMFQSSLLKNSIFSIIIVLIAAIGIGILISNRMSKDLIYTAEMAQNLDIGNDKPIRRSKVKEIHIIQQSLESLQSRLKIKQKSRKTLIDELVHQTRTPLTILRTHLEGIEDGIIEYTPEVIRTCENQIDNITEIITNMSNMIDVEKTDIQITIEEFELSQLIRQIINGLRTQFENKNIDLRYSADEKTNIKTDKYRLSQTIYNILTNAYKFTEANGKVYVSYHINQETIDIIIEDNGSGINKNEHDRIFNAYYKNNNKLADISGDGLGLYIAKENMTSIHGTIAVESEMNKGSRFILTLPRAIT